MRGAKSGIQNTFKERTHRKRKEEEVLVGQLGSSKVRFVSKGPEPSIMETLLDIPCLKIDLPEPEQKEKPKKKKLPAKSKEQQSVTLKEEVKELPIKEESTKEKSPVLEDETTLSIEYAIVLQMKQMIEGNRQELKTMAKLLDTIEDATFKANSKKEIERIEKLYKEVKQALGRLISEYFAYQEKLYLETSSIKDHTIDELLEKYTQYEKCNVGALSSRYLDEYALFHKVFLLNLAKERVAQEIKAQKQVTLKKEEMIVYDEKQFASVQKMQKLMDAELDRQKEIVQDFYAKVQSITMKEQISVKQGVVYTLDETGSRCFLAMLGASLFTTKGILAHLVGIYLMNKAIRGNRKILQGDPVETITYEPSAHYLKDITTSQNQFFLYQSLLYDSLHELRSLRTDYAKEFDGYLDDKQYIANMKLFDDMEKALLDQETKVDQIMNDYQEVASLEQEHTRSR